MIKTKITKKAFKTAKAKPAKAKPASDSAIVKAKPIEAGDYLSDGHGVRKILFNNGKVRLCEEFQDRHGLTISEIKDWMKLHGHFNITEKEVPELNALNALNPNKKYHASTYSAMSFEMIKAVDVSKHKELFEKSGYKMTIIKKKKEPKFRLQDYVELKDGSCLRIVGFNKEKVLLADSTSTNTLNKFCAKNPRCKRQLGNEYVRVVSEKDIVAIRKLDLGDTIFDTGNLIIGLDRKIGKLVYKCSNYGFKPLAKNTSETLEMLDNYVNEDGRIINFDEISSFTTKTGTLQHKIPKFDFATVQINDTVIYNGGKFKIKSKVLNTLDLENWGTIIITDTTRIKLDKKYKPPVIKNTKDVDQILNDLEPRLQDFVKLKDGSVLRVVAISDNKIAVADNASFTELSKFKKEFKTSIFDKSEYVSVFDKSDILKIFRINPGVIIDNYTVKEINRLESTYETEFTHFNKIFPGSTFEVKHKELTSKLPPIKIKDIKKGDILAVDNEKIVVAAVSKDKIYYINTYGQSTASIYKSESEQFVKNNLDKNKLYYHLFFSDVKGCIRKIKPIDKPVLKVDPIKVDPIKVDPPKEEVWNPLFKEGQFVQTQNIYSSFSSNILSIDKNTKRYLIPMRLGSLHYNECQGLENFEKNVNLLKQSTGADLSLAYEKYFGWVSENELVARTTPKIVPGEYLFIRGKLLKVEAIPPGGKPYFKDHTIGRPTLKNYFLKNCYPEYDKYNTFDENDEDYSKYKITRDNFPLPDSVGVVEIDKKRYGFTLNLEHNTISLWCSDRYKDEKIISFSEFFNLKPKFMAINSDEFKIGDKVEIDGKITKIVRIDKFWYYVTDGNPISRCDLHKIKKITEDPDLNQKEKSTLRKEADTSLYRIGARKINKSAKEVLLAMLRNNKLNNKNIKVISSLLETEYGNAVTSAGVSLALSRKESWQKDPRISKLTEELKIDSMAIAMNSVFNDVAKKLIKPKENNIRVSELSSTQALEEESDLDQEEVLTCQTII